MATFPHEAFEADVVVHRSLAHRQFIFSRPEAIRRILIENSGNYTRTAPTIRVLSPIFGRGLFLSAGEEWRGQRRILAPTFAPRAIRILAKHVAVAAGSLIAELMAAGTERIDLFPATAACAGDYRIRDVLAGDEKTQDGDVSAHFGLCCTAWAPDLA